MKKAIRSILSVMVCLFAVDAWAGGIYAPPGQLRVTNSNYLRITNNEGSTMRIRCIAVIVSGTGTGTTAVTDLNISSRSTGDCQPSSGVEWLIQSVIHAGNITLSHYDGTNAVAFATSTEVPNRPGCTIELNPGTDVLQKALDSLSNNGGTICLKEGRYVQTSTLTFGNGTTSSPSTKNGMRILGVAPPSPTMWQAFTTATTIECTVSAPGVCIQVNGPVEGWGLENLKILGDGIDLLKVTSGHYGRVENLWFSYTSTSPTRGIFLTTQNAYVEGENHDAYGNRFYNVIVEIGDGLGVVLDGGSDGLASPDFNHFERLDIVMKDVDGTALRLGTTDGNSFMNIHTTGASGANGINFDYTNEGPHGNSFWQVDTGDHTITNTGSPSGSTFNYIYGFSEVNGAACPNLANLKLIGCSTNHL